VSKQVKEAEVEEFSFDDYRQVDEDKKYNYYVRTGDPTDVFRGLPNYVAVDKQFGRIEHTAMTWATVVFFKKAVEEQEAALDLGNLPILNPSDGDAGPTAH
jgi:O-phosphoseryl-tRNA(Cys) synthetase